MLLVVTKDECGFEVENFYEDPRTGTSLKKSSTQKKLMKELSGGPFWFVPSVPIVYWLLICLFENTSFVFLMNSLDLFQWMSYLSDWNKPRRRKANLNSWFRGKCFIVVSLGVWRIAPLGPDVCFLWPTSIKWRARFHVLWCFAAAEKILVNNCLSTCAQACLLCYHAHLPIVCNHCKV